MTLSLAMRTIAWDIDDVLNDLMRSWLEEWWRPAHPECRVAYQELVENPPPRLLECTLQEYLASLDAYRLSGSYERMPPLSAVRAWFETHGRRCRHLALTAVPLRAAPVSAAWVTRHFGRWLRTFHFVPSPRDDEDLPGYERDKEEFLRRGGVDLLIDDQPKNVQGAERAGVRAILFPRPWNRSTRTIVDTLEEVRNLIE